jgi:hypothetical protein
VPAKRFAKLQDEFFETSLMPIRSRARPLRGPFPLTPQNFLARTQMDSRRRHAPGMEALIPQTPIHDNQGTQTVPQIVATSPTTPRECEDLDSWAPHCRPNDADKLLPFVTADFKFGSAPPKKLISSDRSSVYIQFVADAALYVFPLVSFACILLK